MGEDERGKHHKQRSERKIQQDTTSQRYHWKMHTKIPWKKKQSDQTPAKGRKSVECMDTHPEKKQSPPKKHSDTESSTHSQQPYLIL